jgi:hypothetical protein
MNEIKHDAAGLFIKSWLEVLHSQVGEYPDIQVQSEYA